MNQNDPKLEAAKKHINDLLTDVQKEINNYLSMEGAPEHLLFYFEDKKQSRGRKQVEDIEKNVDGMQVL